MSSVSAARLQQNSEFQASIYLTDSDKMNRAGDRNFLRQLEELQRLNPDRAEKFLRESSYLAPVDRYELSKAFGVSTNSSDLRAMEGQVNQQRDSIRLLRGSTAMAVAGVLSENKPKQTDAVSLGAHIEHRLLNNRLTTEQTKQVLHEYKTPSNDIGTKRQLLEMASRLPPGPQNDDWKLELLLPYELRGSSSYCFSAGSRQSRRHLIGLQSDHGNLRSNVCGKLCTDASSN